MNVEALLGLAVVSIDESTVVGHVDALFFEPRQRRLALLEIVAAGQRARIPVAAVHHLGTDAVTVPAAGVVQWLNPTSIPAEQAGLLRLEELVKLTVVDEAGTVLGKVSSIALDPEDGTISEVRVHQGGVLGLGGTTHTISGEQIRSASAELMVVAAQAPPAPERPAPEAVEGEAGARTGQEHDGGRR